MSLVACISLALLFSSSTRCTPQSPNPSNQWLQPRSERDSHSEVFPAEFMWGVGSASFPTEGSWDADGKGMSIWDQFTLQSPPGASSNSYAQFEEDLEAITFLGVNFYSFSLSWSRIFPNGTGAVNQAGVDHYRNMIRKLKEVNLEPVVTLYHWDLPQALQERFGGWLNSSMVQIFSEYAEFCFRTFGAEVRYWITMHEPFLMAVQGYGTGTHAPGMRGGRLEPFIAAHNLIRDLLSRSPPSVQAHAEAFHIYDTLFRPHHHGDLSISLGSHWVEPLHGQVTPTNLALSHKAMDAVIGWFAEPIHGSGDYPDSLKKEHRGVIPEFTSEEQARVRGSAHFFALAFGVETQRVGRAVARYGQEVKLDLRGALMWVKRAYGDPRVLVSQSGWYSEGSMGIEDTTNIYIIKKFILQVMQAVTRDAVQVFGYTAWSLLDGFEWSHGFTMRTGLFYIDFSEPERRRIPKTSALFYRSTIRENGLPLEQEEEEETVRRFPCTFQLGVAESTLQVPVHPVFSQFSDPHLYLWNRSGDGALSLVSGVSLLDRPPHCSDSLSVQRLLNRLRLSGSAHFRFALDWGQLASPLGLNPESVRFYRCVLRELRHSGIQPLVTLYHPSYRSPTLGLPEMLQANGGWRNQSVVEAFANYASMCFREFGEFVSMWITINEPNRLIEAYARNPEEKLAVTRFLLLAHAKAWRVYDANFRSQQGALVSLALHADWVEPANPFLESHKEAQQRFLLYELARFLDPLLPRSGLGQNSSSSLVGFLAEERAELKGALDFVALNHFTTRLVAPGRKHSEALDPDWILMIDPSWPVSRMGQAVFPPGLRRALVWVTKRYGPGKNIVITSSGVDDQALHEDWLRQRFIQSYLQEALKALRSDGVPLKGFYLWKLQDHQDLRFGLFSSTTHHSRPKASVALYRDIITSHGFPSLADSEPRPCQIPQRHCAVCILIGQNKPLLFFSACVTVSVSLLGAALFISALKTRRMRKMEMNTIPERISTIRVAHRRNISRLRRE
ncbi:hypothetical protein DNTS_014629 [Danionella cerebrum]|uniref:Klotho beta n=1 Tax=Danionella cerebrum TaxID=2873325 RepID=A0A553R8I3_9TELE|nr:hypothetical protein DNTS_014629 [Danionella translucida]